MYKFAEVMEDSDESDYNDVSSFSYPGDRPRPVTSNVFRRNLGLNSGHSRPALPPRILPLFSRQQKVGSASAKENNKSLEDGKHVEETEELGATSSNCSEDSISRSLSSVKLSSTPSCQQLSQLPDNEAVRTSVSGNIPPTALTKLNVRHPSATPYKDQENLYSATPVSQPSKAENKVTGSRTVITSRNSSQYYNAPVASSHCMQSTPFKQEELEKKFINEFQSSSKPKRPVSHNIVNTSRDIFSKKWTPTVETFTKVQVLDSNCGSERKPKIIGNNKENDSTPQGIEIPVKKISTDEVVGVRLPFKETVGESNKLVSSNDFKVPAKKTLFNDADLNEVPVQPEEKLPLKNAAKNEKQAAVSVNGSSDSKTKAVLTVKDKEYSVLSMLGMGGSSHVYQVLEPKTHRLLAIKCVKLGDTDPATAEGYLNEIELLSKLQNSSKVIKLFDQEYVKQQQILYVVMEKGDIDLSTLLKKMWKSKEVISMPMIIYYWTEMLSAVKDIHDYGIVHSDLKPANFLLVAGRLKLIDFGIASSVQNDMTSIHKNGMVGTYNYMSPEAIQDPGDKTRTKVGYKSDVWSLGCILYSMLYGKTPFQHITSVLAKLQTITNPDHKINYPHLEKCPPAVMEAVKSCLTHNSRFRPTVTELLNLPYISYAPAKKM